MTSELWEHDFAWLTGQTMNTATLLAFASAIFGGALAFAVAWNERRAAVPFSFVAGMVALSVESVFNGLSLGAGTVNELVYWQHWRLAAMACFPGIWLYFSLSYGRGNQRDFLNRWRWWLAVFFLVPLSLVLFLNPYLIVSAVQNQPGHWLLGLGQAGFALNLLLLVSVVLVAMNLERTYRASVGTMRWRIKFMILGLIVLFVVRFYTSSQTLILQAIDRNLLVVDSGALLVGGILIFRSLFRAGHFDMDVYPSHSVLQNSLTVLLAGIYLLIIGVFAKFLTYLGKGGDEAFTAKAFVILAALVALAILLLSDRVRLYTSRFVSRHFQRPLYDYRTVWRKFTEATASCGNQTELCQAAVKSVTDIFQALSVTIWLVDDQKEQLSFAASTFLSEARAEHLLPPKAAVAEVINILQGRNEPIDIDEDKTGWAATLQQCHPDEFQKGGHRVCVPMIVGDQMVGFMILGDRVGGLAFSWQDFDLLKCIGDQLAAGLLNTRLSQKLLQAKELEAFQTMSAFFVHDLKNTANTLNLMLQNLPVHFDDPAFRADALRGVAKTVANINRLIGRLSSIRHELQIKPVPADLNEVVAKALAGWEEVAGINLTKDLQPLPPVKFDADQMFKVATNLIFNAREAVAKTGLVHIATSQSNGWAILAVTDNGCGMSPEFISRSLFRPFQTTKKNGLGIGMFQSKMIVEAHRGKIEVESEPGHGATFRIYLPVQSQ
jgi:putative PEP-CTERM system histidine kinase